MVPSINQIIVNQSVVFGCDWIDWKAPNMLELTLTGFQDSSHGGFTLFTLPDTVPWDGPSKGNIIESEGFIAIQTHVCPRCWHSLCFPLFFSVFWSILHVFLVTRKTIGIHRPLFIRPQGDPRTNSMAQPMQEGSAFMATKTSHVETAPLYGPSHMWSHSLHPPWWMYGKVYYFWRDGINEWCLVADHASLGVPEFGPLSSRCWENAYKYLRSWSITQTCLDSHESFWTRMNNPNDVFWGTYWNHPTASVMVSWCHLDVHPASPEIGVPPNHPF